MRACVRVCETVCMHICMYVCKFVCIAMHSAGQKCWANSGLKKKVLVEKNSAKICIIID